MTKEQVVILIEQMNAVANASSSDNISWQAYREAETLHDSLLFPILEEIICDNTTTKGNRVRKAAYFIFGKILKNRFEWAACDFLIQQLTRETNKYIIADILDRVAEIELPADMNIEPIILHSKSDIGLIRHSAIRALGSSATQYSIEALAYYLNQTEERTFKYELVYANAALGRIGDESTIPLLEKHTSSRIRDVRDSAKFAIERIKEKSQPT